MVVVYEEQVMNEACVPATSWESALQPLALRPLYSIPLETPVLSLPWLIFRYYTCNMCVSLP